MIKIATDASPEARAERLKYLRRLANLTREEMCDDGMINVHTLVGWENARFGGLSKSGANKIIKRLEKAGLTCSLDWLLSGENDQPKLNFHSIPTHHETSTYQNNPEDGNKEFSLKELALFKSHYANAVDLTIADNFMAPYYNPGDIVAGVKRTGDYIHSLIGVDCIVETVDHRYYLRTLNRGEVSDTYTLTCSNLKLLSHQNAVIYNVKLLSAAAVVWIRKKEVI